MASTNNIQNGTSSPSSSCSEYLYDVFLSFGGDTRNSFTDHLYHALDKEIKTFRDNEELDTGKPISSELLKAIEKSRIAVVVLSEKYAYSTWCLEELAKILECMDAGRMGVRPIFYKVDPSDVRHLKGTFADAFAKHVLAIFYHVVDDEERFKENVEKKVRRWRDALRRMADLSGYHLKEESESQFIRKFVGGISSELNGTIIGSVYQNTFAGHQRDVKDFTCTVLKAVNSCIDNLCVFRNTFKEPTVYRRLPIYHDEVSGVGGSYAMDPRPQWSPSSPEETNAGTPQYSYEDPPDNQISKTSYKTAHDLDFHPLLCYNSCFPPSKVTQEWFSQQSRGHSVTIDIPLNLCDDNNWMGLALFALFSMHGDKEAFQYNLMSEIPQFLYCQLGTSVAGLDSEILASHTSGAEIEWLNNQGEFIWICYVPREPLKYMLRQCSHIEASFVSDWPGVTVQACVLRLLYLHDQLQFQQNMKQCNLILEKSDFASQFLADQEKTNGQNLDDEAGTPTTSSSNGDYFKRRPIYQGKTNEDFDRCLIYNSCFPQIEIVDWFSHQSDEPRVTILLPPNDTTWTGLALFAYFSVLDHSSTLIGNLDSQVRCRLGFLSQNSNFCLESLHSYCLTEEDVSLLKQGGFMWLSYIPRGQFPKWLSRCSSIEAEISDCQGLTVHKCGLHLLYQNDEEFKETIRLFKASFSNNHENEAKASPSNSANDQDSHPDEDFDRCLIYNSCFPQSEVVDWFSDQSNGPRVTIILPPNLYDDTTWTGLALFAFFSVLHSTTLVGSQGSQVHCRLWFLSQNRNFCLESLHSYCLTEEDISLLKLGGFMWLSYIPRGWFPKWLNRCSSIEAEINDFPGLTVQKYGLNLLYQNDEEEFKETIRLCKASFSNNHENDEDSHPERLASNEDLHNETSRRPINQGVSDEANSQLCKTSQRPISKLLPSTSENVEEEEDCTSLQTFPNQEFDAGTETIPFRNEQSGTAAETIRMLLTWFTGFAQDPCNHRSIYNQCFPESEIPEWFSSQNKGNSVRIEIPQNLFNDSKWMGFAMCAVFPFHKHPTAVRMDLDSGVPHRVICELQTDIGGMKPISTPYSISEDEVLISLYKRALLWVSFTPSGDWMRSYEYCNQMSWATFLFGSDTPDVVSSAVKCGVHLVYRHNFDEFTRTIVRLLTSYVDYLHLTRSSSKKEHTSLGGLTTPKPFYQMGPLDFASSLLYNSCFPPNEILEWFEHQSDDPQVTIPLPPNLYDDSTWLGLALCVSCSVEDHGTTIVDIRDLPAPSNFITCLLETDICGLGHVQMDHMYRLTKEDLMLLQPSGFIWLSYIPRESFPNWLNQSHFIEASIGTDLLGLTVHKCGFRLLYQNDETEFKETITRLSQTQEDKATDPSSTSALMIPGLKTRAKES